MAKKKTITDNNKVARRLAQQAGQAYEAGDYLNYRRLNRKILAEQPDSDLARQARLANEAIKPGKWVWGPALAAALLYLIGWIAALT